ncbi:unnamed protein product [Prorocentrum cordatum]|uniref:Uncharacterized protein n=1 Tax=Prorocentrum cordatum TaxID=2364126 RepID=A0ABN9TND6_9DINO|nr:unnamed protein product [Polarella glacialis]
MARCFASAALLLLLALPGQAVTVSKEGKEGTEAAVDESSERPPKPLSTAPQPLAPFGEPVVGQARNSEAGDRDKARTPSLLTMNVDDQRVHMWDSAHSYVKGGPPLNKNGDTFDIHLKSQI